MKFKSLLSITLLAAAIMPMQAKHITADEALQRVSSQILTHRVGPTQQMVLEKTVLDRVSQDQIAYIFSRPASQGFMILSADDTLVPVLAYSDEGSIDASDLPPAMLWWLEGCAAQPSEAALSIPKSRDTRSEVTPLISTKWDQRSPYNDQCPIIQGKHAVTGCVATAMSQIMNYYQWPLQGTGTREYDFVAYDETYTDSFDFGSTTFDWENMTDTYGYYSTPEQREAVATLMHACGVAALMTYTDEESAASSINASMGMIYNLGYDKSMTYHERAWYSYDDWCSLIYDQLALGQPVFFGGQDQSGEKGHQFICDGYGADNYFHFNWGWGGRSDGYYYMYDLHPQDQGAGSNGSDYDYGQSVVIDIKPAKENSEYVPILFAQEFKSTQASVERGLMKELHISGKFLSITYSNIDVNLGLKLVDKAGNVQYVATRVLYTCTIPINNKFNGFDGYYIRALDIPEGEWEASPAFLSPSGEWIPMYCDLTKCTGKLYLKVTSDRIEFNQNNHSLTGEFVGMKLAHSADAFSTNTLISAGETYIVQYKITSNGSWHGDIRCAVRNGKDKLDLGSPQSVTFNGASTQIVNFELPISPARKSGKYPLALYTYGNDFKPVDLLIDQITVEGAPGRVTEVKYLPATETETEYYLNHTYTFDFEITVDAKWSDKIYCALLKDLRFVVGASDELEVIIPEAGSQTVSFKMTLDPTKFEPHLTPGSYELVLLEDLNLINNHLLCTINVSAEDVPVEATAIYYTWNPANGMDMGIFPGRQYNFVYDVTTDGIWKGDIYCSISNGINTATSERIKLDTKEGATTPEILTIGLGEDFELGEYELTLFAEQKGVTKEIDRRTVNVEELFANLVAVYIGVTEVTDVDEGDPETPGDDEEDPETPGDDEGDVETSGGDEAETPGDEEGDPETPGDDEGDTNTPHEGVDQSVPELYSDTDDEAEDEEPEEPAPLYAGRTYAFSYDVTSDNGPWDATVFCAIYLDEESFIQVSEDVDLQFATAETSHVDVLLTLIDSLEPGVYNIAMYDATGEDPRMLCTDTIEVAEVDGISSAIAESSEVIYYNLRGLPVQHPTPGSILIKVQGNKVTKVLVK